MTSKRLSVFGCVLAAIGALIDVAGAEEMWIGKKVYLKPDVKLRLKDQEIEDGMIGQYPNPATVTGVDGRRLLLGDYWVHDNEVLTQEDQAAVFVFRGRIMHGRREYDAALAVFEKAEKLDPNNATLYNSRGKTQVARKELDLAIQDFDAAIRLAPRHVEGYLNRVSALRSKGDIDAALKDYDRLIELEPKATTHWIERSEAVRSKGDVAGAIRDLSKAIDLAPANLAYYRNRAALLRANGKADEAEESFAKLIELRTKAIHSNPGNPQGYTNRGVVLEAKQDFAGALSDYSKANELDASFADGYNGLAWLRATCASAEFRDGQKAVHDATKACELTKFRNASYVDTLAAAYAEAGDFEKAVEWQSKALGLFAPNQARWGDMERSVAQARLDLYRQRKPFRTEQN